MKIGTTLIVIAVMIIVVLGAIYVVFMPHSIAHSDTDNITTMDCQQNTVPSPTITATYRTFFCEDEPQTLLYVDYPWWNTWWSLDKDQVTQLQFFEDCKYRNKFPAWKLSEYEGFVDAKIMAYKQDYRQEVVIKNWSFRKIIYFDRGVKIKNNTELAPYPKGEITSYLLRISNPMENNEIFLYYFHNDDVIVAVGWGNETNGVLRKFDTSGSGGDTYGGGGNSGGPADGDIPGDGGPSDGPI